MPVPLSPLSCVSPSGDNTDLEKSPSHDMPTTSSGQYATNWPSLREPQRELLDEQVGSEVLLERTRNKTSLKGKERAITMPLGEEDHVSPPPARKSSRKGKKRY